VILVIGIGNPDRGDDAAGLEVARRVRAATSPGEVTVRELAGDQLALIDEWAGATEVYVVDAVCSGGVPGTVYRFDAAQALTGRFHNRGTHMFSLADVIELARALGRLPGQLTGYGIEGASFAIGDGRSGGGRSGGGLSLAVAAAVDNVTSLLLNDLKAGV
jgi:hydrogenase maturation protease